LQGIQGETGANKNTGAKGETGTKGDTGAKGDTGLQGIQGDTEAKGDTGAKGETKTKGILVRLDYKVFKVYKVRLGILQRLTNGLQTALDSKAKLDLANTFTCFQTVVSDLNEDDVLVQNITPTLLTHLTSKLYVDTALNGKENTISASTDLNCKSISTQLGSVGTTNLFMDLNLLDHLIIIYD